MTIWEHGQASTDASALSDGSASLPSLAFASLNTAGWYYDATTKWTFVDTDQVSAQVSLVDLGLRTVNNSETPSPTDVEYAVRAYHPTPEDATEVTWLYYLADHSGTGKFPYLIYAEQDADQGIADSSVIKCIHRGKGDFCYCGLMRPDSDGGFGYEAAHFKDSSTGFLATVQRGYQESDADMSNIVPFVALWADDDVASAFLCNYGMFYANNAFSNAFCCHTSSQASLGNVFIQLGNKSVGPSPSIRHRYRVHGQGEVHVLGAEATAGTQHQDSPKMVWRGSYWTGAAEQTTEVYMLCHVDTGDDTPQLYLYGGDTGSETLWAIWKAATLDMQDHTITGLGGITMYDATSPIDMNDAVITNCGGITMHSSDDPIDLQDSVISNCGGITMHDSTDPLDLQNSVITNCGKLTMQNGGNGLDMQAASIVTCGALTAYNGSNYDITEFYNMSLRGNTFRLATARTVTNSNDAGNAGDICWDSSYVYVCVAASTWKRAAISTW